VSRSHAEADKVRHALLMRLFAMQHNTDYLRNLRIHLSLPA